MSAIAASDGGDFRSALAVFARQLRRVGCLLSGVVLTAVSARAEAPVLSPEFWNYMIEFGDGKGEIFDPADYAAITTLPAKARADLDRAATQDRAAVPQSAADSRAASQGKEQSR